MKRYGQNHNNTMSQIVWEYKKDAYVYNVKIILKEGLHNKIRKAQPVESEVNDVSKDFKVMDFDTVARKYESWRWNVQEAKAYHGL